jgi:hypothetical protein
MERGGERGIYDGASSGGAAVTERPWSCRAGAGEAPSGGNLRYRFSRVIEYPGPVARILGARSEELAAGSGVETALCPTRTLAHGRAL